MGGRSSKRHCPPNPSEISPNPSEISAAQRSRLTATEHWDKHKRQTHLEAMACIRKAIQQSSERGRFTHSEIFWKQADKPYNFDKIQLKLEEDGYRVEYKNSPRSEVITVSW